MAKKPESPKPSLREDAGPPPLMFPVEDGSELAADETYRNEMVVDDATGFVRSRAVWSGGQRYEHVSDLPNGRWVYRQS